MQTIPVPVSLLQPPPRVRPRTALVASADGSFRDRLSRTLTGLRWQVREAASGAQAWSEAETAAPEAVILDSWLPDLDLNEFVIDFRGRFPQTDLITAGGSEDKENIRGPHRQELLYALRRSQDTDTAAWNTAPDLTSSDAITANIGPPTVVLKPVLFASAATPREVSPPSEFGLAKTLSFRIGQHTEGEQKAIERLPELIGDASCMLEVSRRIRLVAQRMTPVLIEGPTGSGKELVAEALHRLSPRSRKPFIAINCAAIPEALLEAELFGHTRGAFTGAVQGRVGRIESADGGTLFLDEIGEMPLALQSKLLRFIESGELQKVGDNETIKVDVRILAATHQPLADHAKAGSFRADLYYRLAVFLIRTPSLIEHAQDLTLLVDHFLRKMGRDEPMKRIDQGAMAKLAAHDWPGNVRELEHVLERAAILAGEEPILTMQEIDFGFSVV
ncbi:MAG: sigma-54 dependent transcriptional regulator [Terracidiphilus sp.]